MNSLPTSYIPESNRPAPYLPESHKKNTRGRGILLLGCGLLLLAIIASLCLGPAALPPARLFPALFSLGDDAAVRIVQHLRIPRTLATVLAGSSLAVAGAVIQAVLNNPLASPGIIGVNSGAAFMVALECAVLPAQAGFTAPAAFLGALLAMLLVYGIGRATGAARTTLILAGIAVSGVFSAGVDVIVTVFPDALSGSTAFRIGGVAGVTLPAVFPQGYAMLLALLLLFFLHNELDVLGLGEDTARSLGLKVGFYRFVFLLLAALLAGLAVSFAGLLSFVGLLAPHIARRLVGLQSRLLLPCCALFGASFLTGCDLLARLLFAPFELPVGLILALLGGPFFLYLLLRQKRRGRHD